MAEMMVVELDFGFVAELVADLVVLTVDATVEKSVLRRYKKL